MRIKLLDKSNIQIIAIIIQNSFATVAEEFCFTMENCPYHPAFITDERADTNRLLKY